MSATTMSQLAGYKGWTLNERLRPLKTPLRAFRKRMIRKPGSTSAMVAASLFGTAILANALAMQTERHPSPMFTDLAAPAAQQMASAAIPTPPVRPAAERRTAEPAAAAPRGEARAARAPKEEVQRTASIGTPKDQMLAIIADGAADAEASSAPNRHALVQRALNKAGYGPVKEDGAFGAGSKKALERFEADRKLPVKGEPQGRTLKELARVSGIPLS